MIKSANKAIIVVTNIPSPYRGFLFKYLYSVAVTYSIDIKVYYCRKTEKGRRFSLSNAFVGYSSKVDSFGLYFSFKNLHFHFNPVILVSLIMHLRNGDSIVLGDCWWSLNNIIILLIHRFLRIFCYGQYSANVGLWVEDSIEPDRKSVVFNKIKTFFYGTSDFFWVPGSLSSAIVSTYLTQTSFTGRSSPIFLLPNLVDLDKFRRFSFTDSAPSERIRVLVVARLVEQLKGISLFIETVASYPCFKELFVVSILGDGIDRMLIEKTIRKHNMCSSIQLLGNLPYDMVSHYMCQSDVFCLPSLIDPSPLSLVEAAFSELPLLASKHCGNHAELIIHEHNGFVFNPLVSSTVHDALDWIVANRKNLSVIGARSRIYACQNFDPNLVLARLVEEMKSNSLV